MFGRRKIAALVAEFIGAGLLTTMILSVQHSGIGYPLFVASAMGLAFLVISFTVGEVSGGYYNPALTIAQWVVGKVSTAATILYVAVQLLGGWAAYYIYVYLVNNHLGPIGGHFTGRILAAEAIGTGVFAFIFAATVYGKGLSRAATASFAGLGLMVGSIAASSGALGLLNPAAALGVRAFAFNGSMGWGTYALGPVIGAIVGTLLYRVLFVDEDDSGLLGGLTMASFTTTREVVTIEPSSKPKATKKSSAKKKK